MITRAITTLFLSIVPAVVSGQQPGTAVPLPKEPLRLQDVLSGDLALRPWPTVLAQVEARCLRGRVRESDLPRSVPVDVRTRLAKACVRDALVDLRVPSHLTDAVEFYVDDAYRPPGVYWQDASVGTVTIPLRTTKPGIRLRATEIRVPVVPGDSLVVQVQPEAAPQLPAPLSLEAVFPELRGQLRAPVVPPEPTFKGNDGVALLAHALLAGATAYQVHRVLSTNGSVCKQKPLERAAYVDGVRREAGYLLDDTACLGTLRGGAYVGGFAMWVGLNRITLGFKNQAHQHALQAWRNDRPVDPRTHPNEWCLSSSAPGCTPAQRERWREAIAALQRREDSVRYVASRWVEQPMLQVSRMTPQRTEFVPVGQAGRKVIHEFPGVEACAGRPRGGVAVILLSQPMALTPLQSLEADRAGLVEFYCRAGVRQVFTISAAHRTTLDRVLAAGGTLEEFVRSASSAPDEPVHVAVVGHGVALPGRDGRSEPRLALTDFNQEDPGRTSAALTELVAGLHRVLGRDRAVTLAWLACFGPQSLPTRLASGSMLEAAADIRLSMLDPTAGSHMVLVTAAEGLQGSAVGANGRQVIIDEMLGALSGADEDGNGVIDSHELGAYLTRTVPLAARRATGERQTPKVWPQPATDTRPAFRAWRDTP